MKFLLPIAAAAAAVLLAVVLGGRFLSNEPTVGGPTSSPTPSLTSQSVGGQYTFGGGNPVSIDATSDGSSLSGTVEGEWAGAPYSIRLECLRQYDPRTWMLAGVLTKSAVSDRTAGDWGAVIVRDGPPQQTGVWLDSKFTADTCEEFVRDIPDNAVEGPDMIGPMDEGSIILPPAPGPSAVTGRFVLHADHDYTVVLNALANSSTLSGIARVTFPEGAITIGLQCARQFDPQTWMFAGEIEDSSGEGLGIGTKIAVTVRDGSPQQANMWPADRPWDSCADFVRNIPDNAVEGQDMIGPVEGGVTLPPAP